MESMKMDFHFSTLYCQFCRVNGTLIQLLPFLQRNTKIGCGDQLNLLLRPNDATTLLGWGVIYLQIAEVIKHINHIHHHHVCW
jgi:hypothetical protein